MARRVHALVVDDSPLSRTMVMRALQQTGLAEFVFTEAGDGLEALGKYRPGETGIIFVDMNMPRMNGIEFVRRLLAQHKQPPRVVVVTGESRQEALREAIAERGVDAILLKPVDRDRLRQGLSHLIVTIPEPTATGVVPNGDCLPAALQSVVADACGLVLTPAPEQDAPAETIIQGMVSFQGAVQWSVAVGFSQEAAVGFASKFACREMTRDDPDLGDAIGELTNMVSGRVKTILAQRALRVEFSLPTVLQASGVKMLLQRKALVDHAYFDSPVGRIWTIVSVGVHAGLIL